MGLVVVDLWHVHYAVPHVLLAKIQLPHE